MSIVVLLLLSVICSLLFVYRNGIAAGSTGDHRLVPGGLVFHLGIFSYTAFSPLSTPSSVRVPGDEGQLVPASVLFYFQFCPCLYGQGSTGYNCDGGRWRDLVWRRKCLGGSIL